MTPHTFFFIIKGSGHFSFLVQPISRKFLSQGPGTSRTRARTSRTRVWFGLLIYMWVGGKKKKNVNKTKIK
jgi:hypothetical protein